MKKILNIIILIFIVNFIVFAQTTTPYTVSMSSGTNNSTAFTSNGNVGTDVATFYIHWDNTYLYLGWSGGRTSYSSDLYYAAIDTDPNGTSGVNSAIEGVNFQSGNALPDFYVVYENNSSYYGIPLSNGNAYEIYGNSSGTWSFISRTDGDDGTSSQIDFQDTGGEVRLRIAWATLSFTPSASSPIGFVMWTNNSSGNYLWAKMPSTSNPPSGSIPITLTHQYVYSSTGAGVNPSTDAVETALPVELTSFSAYILSEGVQLNWTTATEVDNYGFSVERKSSFAQVAWETLGFVQGHGNSNSPKEYSFLDNGVTSGKYAYRLKQIDTDGAFEYSDVIEVDVELPTKYELSQNYPNPFSKGSGGNPATTIGYSLPETQYVRLAVFNVLGEEVALLVNEKKAAGKYNVTFNASNLPSGLYLYSLQTENFSQTKKMMLLK